MIMKETGMSWDDVLYKRSWINIKMLLADAPRLNKASKTGHNKKEVIPISGSDLASNLGLK